MQGDVAAAIALLQKAIAIKMRALGEQHPDVRDMRAGLAALKRDMKKAAQKTSKEKKRREL